MLTNAQCVHSHSYLFGIFQCERVPESPISPKAALILLLLSWEPLKLKLATTLFVGALISSCAVSESKTLGLIISGKLSSESMLCEMMVIVGRTRQNTKHKNSIVGVMVPTWWRRAMTGTVRSNPSWGRLILTAVVSAICTGAIVAAVCVWAFTPRPQIPTSKDGELPPPLAPPSSSGAMWASDEGQGSAVYSS